MTEDYLHYYDGESYLFETVRKRFADSGMIDAFDLFSIIIWKANRAKTKIAQRLMKHGDLETAAAKFSADLRAATTPETRLAVAMQDWGFYLPMATSILSVLWPDDFTVYDYRVCEELNDFYKLGDQTNQEKIWAGYRQYRKAVEAAVAEQMSLRDKDRFLWGRSAAKQLCRDILRGFASD
jgi:hypothetical protein